MQLMLEMSVVTLRSVSATAATWSLPQEDGLAACETQSLLVPCCYPQAVKNAVFWDVTPCGSCKNRRFKGIYRLLLQGDMNR
jgi:hypothetical protein